jgi:hypothetical protein
VTDGASFVQKMAGRDIHRLLQEKITGLPQLGAVTLISREGKLTNFSRAWPVPEVDVSDRSYFRALRDDPTLQSYISEPVQNRVTGASTIFLAHRVGGPNGEFLGLIMGAIEMRYFEDFYAAISLGESGSVALQRTDGVMLARFRALPPSARSSPTPSAFCAAAARARCASPARSMGRCASRPRIS